MTDKVVRSLKVCGTSGYQYKTTPTIMLKGQWLLQTGFQIGDYIKVSYEDGRIVITPDIERTTSEEAKGEFMDREMILRQKRLKEEKLRTQLVAEVTSAYGN